ncbi:MAG: DUF6807 family protein [Pirellulales bacterium]
MSTSRPTDKFVDTLVSHVLANDVLAMAKTVGRLTFTRLATPLMLLLAIPVLCMADLPDVAFDTTKPGKIAMSINRQPVAVYVYEDKGSPITRPYFAHVCAPGGIQVTRNHPPIEGQDLSDHASYHPGIWMSFGDISGSDYWRLAARTEHVQFEEQPTVVPGRGSFTVLNRYLDQNDPTKVICEERASYTLMMTPVGYLILWDSTFSSEQEFYFGDQEEMGLGFRVATPLRAEKKSEKYPNIEGGNGTILDAKGRANGKEIWGNSADWCDYSGTLRGKQVGITIFCNPKNFRPSWFHARDYGLLEANPFGRDAFGKGKVSKEVVKPGEKLRLRYGILLHKTPRGTPADLDLAYAYYLKLAGKK